jgi:hypothetical protein
LQTITQQDYNYTALACKINLFCATVLKSSSTAITFGSVIGSPSNTYYLASQLYEQQYPGFVANPAGTFSSSTNAGTTTTNTLGQTSTATTTSSTSATTTSSGLTLGANFVTVATNAFTGAASAGESAGIVAAVQAIQAAGGGNADIAAAMDYFGINVQTMATALGLDVATLQAAYNSLDPHGPYAT